MRKITKITLYFCERYNHSGLFLYEAQSINVLFHLSIEEILTTATVLLYCNRPQGYCDSITIVEVLLQQYCDSFQEYLFLINVLYFKKSLRSGGHTIQLLCGSRITTLKHSRCSRMGDCLHFFFTIIVTLRIEDR